MDGRHTGLMNAVDAKHGEVGSPKVDVLMFSLGGEHRFSMDIFKIKEVMPCPEITHVPNMRAGVLGKFSLRGEMVYALDLGFFVGLSPKSIGSNRVIIVTEYNQFIYGVVVDSIGENIRLEDDKIKITDKNLANRSALITKQAVLQNNSVISILDTEQILSDVFTEFNEGFGNDMKSSARVLSGQGFYVDDSEVARQKIQDVFNFLGVKAQSSKGGAEAWEQLQHMARAASLVGVPLSDDLKVILVDAEMPVLDGYLLTRLIKADLRFQGIPVVLHSFLYSQVNRAMGDAVKADGYVAKFKPNFFVEAILTYWTS